MRPLSLRTLLIGTTVGLVVAAVLVVGVEAVRLLGRLANEQALARVRLAGATAAEIVARSGSDLDTTARLLSERPTLHRYLDAGRDEDLRGFLDRFGATGGISGCAVIEPGRVVAGGDPTLPWDRIAAEGREGGEGAFLLSGESRSLVLAAVVRGTAPGASEGGTGVAVAAARRLDATFAAEIAVRVGLAVALVDRERALATADDPRSVLRNPVFTEGAPRAARLDAAGAFVAVEPVRDRSGAVLGTVETTLDTRTVDDSVSRLVRLLVLTTLVVTGAAIALAALLARGIVRPLEALTEASFRIGRGDLSSPIANSGGAEAGVLASTMEEMRGRLLALTAELRRKQAEAEAVLTGIMEGVFAVDRERRITYVNPQAASMLGLRADEVVGRFCGDVLRPDAPGGVRPCEDRCPILDARFRGGARATEQLSLPQGQRRTVVITSAAPAPPSPGDSARALQQFQVMRDETEEAAARRLRDLVLANISHEFRTPLSAQLASLEMLRDRLRETEGEELHDLLRSVERAALRLTRLVDNLLESLRIEAGRDSIRRLPVALDQVVEEAVQLTAPLIQQKGQALEVDLPYPLPAVQGDAPRLTQVFVNLLANANKFAPAGSRIAVGGAVESSEIALWVEDEGPGLPGEIGGRLFERFLRAPGEEPEETGMGLGLWIVNSIVTRHGGRVDARNTPAGARFTVFLPRRSP